MKTLICKLILLAISVVTLASACSSFPLVQRIESIPNKELPFPTGDYRLLNIVNNKLTGWVEGERPGNQPWRTQWFYTFEGDQELHEINFPLDPACTRGMVYDVGRTRPDGRIQLTKLCRIGPPDYERKTWPFLMAYDFQESKMEEIAGPLPLGSYSPSWNPDMTRAVINLDSGFSSQTLFWLWDDGFGPMDILIEDDGVSWNLKYFFPDFPDSEALRTGNAERAVWSPDGSTIAFFASGDVVGESGFDRFYIEYKLYFMDADQLEPYPVFDSVYFPHLIEWSPDSKHIAFSGQHGSLKSKGLWIYSLESGSVISVEKGDFQTILWRPDGRSLVAIRCDEDHFCSQVVEYDLTKIVQP